MTWRAEPADRDGHWLFDREAPVLWGSTRRIQAGSEEDHKRESMRAGEWAAFLRLGEQLLRAHHILFPQR